MPEEPVDTGYSLVIPAGDAILKLNPPDEESEHEAEALERWGGRGAARLLARDDERRALLIERLRPGTQLWSLPDDEATEIAAGVLEQLWIPAGEPFRRLEDEAVRWAEALSIHVPAPGTKPWPDERVGTARARPAPEFAAGAVRSGCPQVRAEGPCLGARHGDTARRDRPTRRGPEPALVDRAVSFLREAGPTQRESVLLHQDLHGGNVLLSEERGWLAIDAKPLVGEREFDVASLIRDRRPATKAQMERRLDHLVERLSLDRERARGWAIAHTLAWNGSATMIESARLLTEPALP